MSKYFQFLLLLLLITSCSDSKNIVGDWKLVSWDIGIEIDADADGIKNSNLLIESDCQNKELLKVEENGTINSKFTFNPTVRINKVDSYDIRVECPKGSIGFASSYTIENERLLLDSEGYFEIIQYEEEGIALKRTFKNAIKIYNYDFSEVTETTDLTLIYTK